MCRIVLISVIFAFIDGYYPGKDAGWRAFSRARVCSASLHVESDTVSLPMGALVLRLRGGQTDETKYEREKRERQAKNLEMMRSLGLNVGGEGGMIKKQVQERKKKIVRRAAGPGIPVRRSQRNMDRKVKYKESSVEEEDDKKDKDAEVDSSEGAWAFRFLFCESLTLLTISSSCSDCCYSRDCLEVQRAV